MVGEAVESDRPIHVSFGGAGIGGARTALALASAEVFYQAARRAASGFRSPIVTVSDPSAIPLAYNALYAAFRARGKADQAPYAGVQWYAGNNARSMAFAAALTGLAHTEHPTGHILVGTWGAEIALVLDAANRRGASSIAGSDDLVGQAVAFGMATTPLIGEEMFAAGAYLDDRGGTLSAAVTIDLLRWLLILAIGAGVALVLINSEALDVGRILGR